MITEIYIPKTITELQQTILGLKKKPFRFASGCTDLLMEHKKNPDMELRLVNLSHIKDKKFISIEVFKRHSWIGGGVTAAQITASSELQNRFPVLTEAALNLASVQIRQVATVGGNLGTASPSGDISCALVALEATIVLLNTQNELREIPISEFFKGPRKTTLKYGEIIYGIKIQNATGNIKNLYSGFVKVGTRKSMECSVVSLAYHIQTHDDGLIVNAGMALGAAAPVIVFPLDTCNMINNSYIHQLNQDMGKKMADLAMKYIKPISDIRATSWYREKVLYNLIQHLPEDWKNNSPYHLY